jgi:hypothetical protein
MTFTEDKIYYIIWDDHWSLTNSWQKQESLSDEPIEVRSIGWCAKDCNDIVHLVSTVDDSNECFGGHMAIMKKSIKNAWELTGIEVEPK